MHVHLKHVGAALLLAGCGSSIAASGCANDDSSLFIAGCLLVARDTCTATRHVDDRHLRGRASIDGGLAKSLHVCAAQVENQLVADGQPDDADDRDGAREPPDGRRQGPRLHGQRLSADPVLQGAGGVQRPDHRASSTWATARTGGLGVSFVEFIDSETAQDLSALAFKKGAQTVQVQVLLHGQTLGGLERPHPALLPLPGHGAGRLRMLPARRRAVQRRHRQAGRGLRARTGRGRRGLPHPRGQYLDGLQDAGCARTPCCSRPRPAPAGGHDGRQFLLQRDVAQRRRSADRRRLRRQAPRGGDQEHHRQREEQQIDLRGDDERRLARGAEPDARLRQQATGDHVPGVEVVAARAPEQLRRRPRARARTCPIPSGRRRRARR